MSKSDLIEDLQSRIAFLEKHVTEQDTEMYQLSKRIDSLVKVAKEQKAQLVAVAELNSQSAVDMPVDEKPPHY
ncbi:MAG: SlyX family protein [Puniceicoccaceae bacterium]|nr:SlyX family protein [Puniceicoccaceae bacterium]